MGTIYKIGHRGAMDLEPENTLRSINKAIDLNVDAVEIDVYRTEDNELVVMHYERVEKTTNGRGLVWDLTLPEIKKLDAGKGEMVPTLQEVIDTVKGRCGVLIELKMYGIEQQVVDLINKNKIKSDSIVISFFHDLMRNVRQIDPGVKTGVTFMCVPVNVSRLAADAGAEYILPQYQFLTPAMVKDAHDNGLKILTWHSEDIEEMKGLVKLGVDGIMTNRPDLF
ncbi:MAG: glycerophosphodiester phosphodiesterase, partial [Spirochaetes bacterium]|nr:glycerophosphodiester phosphodiesterase [Spirochaetota bacterium]